MVEDALGRDRSRPRLAALAAVQALKAACHIGVLLARLAGRELGLLLAAGVGRQTSPCDGIADASWLSPWGVLLFRNPGFGISILFLLRSVLDASH